MQRLKTSEIKELREALLGKQKGVCPLCGERIQLGQATLDHDHKTGFIRSVLCRNCNSMEGKVFNAATRAKRTSTAILWLKKMIKYHETHDNKPSGVYHPTYKTPEEKKALVAKRRKK